MLIIFVLLFWRSFYGFCWSDESFYVSTADRFYRGDVPLVTEWFRTQLSSVVMLPFYALFVLITGSNAGIILYFRILYLILSTFAAVIVYSVLKKKYPEGVAVLAALPVMLYAHLGNATFSYYMLSFIFLILGLILIYDSTVTKKKSRLVCAGIALALSTLSMPAFAVGVLAVLIIVPVFSGIYRSARDVFVYTAAGILVTAAVFLLYMLTRDGISDITETLSYALVDNEHTNTFGYYIRKPHRSLMEVFGSLTWFSYALIAVSVLFQRILRKLPYCFLTVFAGAVLFAIEAYIARGHSGYIQVVFMMFMIPVFFVSQKKNLILFYLMTVPSVIVAVIYCFTSSDFLYVMAIGAAVSMPAGVCVLYDFYDGNIKKSSYKTAGKCTAAVLAAVCIFCLVTTAVLRIVNVYRDSPLRRLDAPISLGVAKGLYTTEEHLRMYEDVSAVIQKYCTGSGHVMFSKILPWGYAESRLDCAYPTTWRSTAYNDEQLEKYYSINPDHQPDVIIVLDEQYGSYDASGDVADDHNPNLDEMSDYWKEYIRNNNMSCVKEKCARVYLKAQ